MQSGSRWLLLIRIYGSGCSFGKTEGRGLRIILNPKLYPDKSGLNKFKALNLNVLKNCGTARITLVFGGRKILVFSSNRKDYEHFIDLRVLE